MLEVKKLRASRLAKHLPSWKKLPGLLQMLRPHLAIKALHLAAEGLRIKLLPLETAEKSYRFRSVVAVDPSAKGLTFCGFHGTTLFPKKVEV